MNFAYALEGMAVTGGRDRASVGNGCPSDHGWLEHVPTTGNRRPHETSNRFSAAGWTRVTVLGGGDLDIRQVAVVVGGLQRLAAAFGGDRAFEMIVLFFEHARVPAVTVETGLETEGGDQRQ